MGIPGLMTFVNNRSDRYLRYYELHDTYLVIDGSSVAFQIYSLYANFNCTFGGDYDKYAQCVSKFFDELLQCNVTPLVLFDGGCEDKKLRTIITRTKEKIQTASSFSPSSQMKFFPMMMKDVFIDVMIEKKIRHVQCLFEADNDIAAVAKILNCPVLSYDSDFYIYGTLYIPFNTLDNPVQKRSTGEGCMRYKCCKIYRVEYLLDSFRGLHRCMLPLAAILLGNDYVQRGTFKNFFKYLNLHRPGKKKYNHRSYHIDAIFTWLSNYTLEKAVISILSRLRKPMRQRILNIIETNINGYTNVFANMLVPLGFSEEYAAQVITHSVHRTFNFTEDIDNLTYIEETCNEGVYESSLEEEEEDEFEILNTMTESELVFTNAFVKNLPAWFVSEFQTGKFPGYFMDLLVRRLYICPVQVEYTSYPASTVVSLRIVRVIFELLKSGTSDNRNTMQYMIRDTGGELVRRELESLDSKFSLALPTLSNLREISLVCRKKILNDTLGIAESLCTDDLPSEWILYIACTKYWTEQQQLYRLHKYYAYSVFVSLLFHVIDSKIGDHINKSSFQVKYGSVVHRIEQERKASNYKPNYSTNVTISKACNNIDREDCLLAASFFIQHFKMDKKLCLNPKKFNRIIVHAFANFQNCLRHAMNLNALLGYPYPQIKIANFFNGTLLYNLCNNFKSRHDIDAYINGVLQSSPSLLTLLHVLLLKIKHLFPFLFQDNNS
ncbi:PREDICTED: protein asteroid [Dufourea novaeangliae]|uniref:Protein asteroid n=1 Tax=Dufourea novaeangliae TaxID=178035 RepID=A0A154PNA7_DUFNO|nr:PREDICTED: protein asteroid [Dufourea novaeangliae]KZC13329.1 Protein asteroid [Dufourea novaeangliae]